MDELMLQTLVNGALVPNFGRVNPLNCDKGEFYVFFEFNNNGDKIRLK
jgi:hypothetical protein